MTIFGSAAINRTLCTIASKLTSRPQDVHTLFNMFNKPEVLDTLLVGAAGVALTHAVTSFLNVPKPARTLLSLAGFGIGNIIYNAFNERKFTTLDESKASVKIKL
jgi:hypothetical protein